MENFFYPVWSSFNYFRHVFIIDKRLLSKFTLLKLKYTKLWQKERL